MKRVYRIFISTKITLFLFALLAICMVIGTVVPQLPQGGSPEDYIAAWGPEKFLRVYMWGLMDIFHAPWFVVLGCLTFVQLLLCTIDGFAALRRRRTASPELLRGGARHVFDVPDIGAGAIREALARRGFRTSVVSDDAGDTVVAERGIPSRLVSIIYHFAFFLFLIGFFLTARYVERGDFYLYPGDQYTLAKGRFARRAAESDSFQIGLEAFITEQTWYEENYFPKDWKSALVVYEDGVEVRRETIEVNDPLRYGGVTVYQSNYQQDFDLLVSGEGIAARRKGGESSEGSDEGSIVSGSAHRRFRIEGQDAHFMVRTIYAGTLFRDGEEPEPIIPNTTLYMYPDEAPTKREKMGELVLGEPFSALGLTFTLIELREATGLSFTRDPGVPLLWVAFIVFMLGIAARVFLPSYRLTFLHDGAEGKIYAGGRVSGLAAYLDEEIKRLPHELT